MKKLIICLTLSILSCTVSAMEIAKAEVDQLGIQLELPYFTISTAQGTRAYTVILNSPPNYDEPEFTITPDTLRGLPVLEGTTQSVEVTFNEDGYRVNIPYLNLATPAGSAVIKLELYTNPDAEQLVFLVDWSSIKKYALTSEEIQGLLYMREEEKLARDVYITMYQTWGQRIFSNISGSEQTHMDRVGELLANYDLEDPAQGNDIGVFTNPVLQELYDDLVEQGSRSLLDALMVGAAIEEIDIIDIQIYSDQIIDNPDIVVVYENLLKGSRNHLRAFVQNIEKQGVPYVSQFLDADVYQTIINNIQ